MYNKFVKLLQEKDISSYVVSKETGVSNSTLSDWKNGKSVPKLKALMDIANYFNVSVNYFLDEDTIPQEEYEEVSEETRVKQEIFDKYKVLFSTSKNLTPKQLETMFKLMDEAFGDKDE
jgi:transcriptional regulator with XRE-family HTH domain